MFVSLDGNFIEFGEFRNVGSCHSQQQQQWPDVSVVRSPPSSPQVPPAKRPTVRAQAAQNNQYKNDVASTALQIARKSVPQAMDYVEIKLPYVFMDRSHK